MKREFISLIFGGSSNEHSISIKTASFMYKELTKLNLDIQPIFISKQNQWFFKIEPPFFFPFEHIDNPKKFKETFLLKNNIKNECNLTSLNTKLAFIGLHGGEGEDGTIQGFLQTLKIPFVGSGVTSSSLAMNKMLANQIFHYQNLNIPNSKTISKKDFKNNLIKHKLKFPIFIKPVCGGSSLNSLIVNKEDELQYALFDFFEKEQNDCLLQEYITGKEVTCCVIENKKGEMALPITEIKTTSTFFDFDAKYQKGKATEITPANLDSELTKEIQSMSLLAHKSLGCKDYSRSDFIITQNNVAYIFELNTLPGMTSTSFLPQQLNAAGINYYNFFTYFIEKYL